MLPSSGLFKQFDCPFQTIDPNEPGSSNLRKCRRYFCHFKHVHKEEVPTAAKPQLRLLTLADLPVQTKKTHVLEYQPEKPALDAANSPKLPSSTVPIYKPTPITSETASVPVYVPTPVTNANYAQEADGDDNVDDDDDASSLIEFGLDPMEDMPLPCYNDNDSEGSLIEFGLDPCENSPFVAPQEAKKKRAHSRSPDRSANKQHKKHRSGSTTRQRSDESKKSHDKKDVHKSSSSKHKHSSSSKSSRHHKSSSHDKDKHKKHSSNGSTGSTGSHHDRHKTSSSSSNHRHEKEKHKHKYDKERSNSKRKTSTDSSSSHKNTAEAPSLKKVKDTQLNFDLDNIFKPTAEDLDRECKMIFEQIEEESIKKQQRQTEKPSTVTAGTLKRQHSAVLEEKHMDTAPSALQKKRVAHENADNQRVQHNHFVPKPNHLQNAMLAVHERQAAAMRKLEEEQAAAKAVLLEAQEKERLATEQLRQAKEQTLTPLIPANYLNPPNIKRERIAPVANVLALQRAKQKVLELQANKVAGFTPMPSKRNTRRIAHKPAVPIPDIAAKDALTRPPVLQSRNNKISFNLRMQFYDMMVKYCELMYPNKVDAWERAQAEELTVFNKCNTPVVYKNSCLLCIGKLKKEAANGGNKTAPTNNMISHEVVLAGKLAKSTSWSVEKRSNAYDANVEPFDRLDACKAYEMVYALCLNEEQLVSNGYPRPGKTKGTAVIKSSKQFRRPSETQRYCARCGTVFSLSMYKEKHVGECLYHSKGSGYAKGSQDNQYRCCHSVFGTPGCYVANYHVTDYLDLDNLTGYVSTIDKPNQVHTKHDIFAIDCEMCYTTHGIELTRVTVVNIDCKVMYDKLVKPDNKIVDYNTMFSGINEEMLNDVTTSLREVQAVLLSMFSSKTVLVGHSLESDLKALKIIHNTVVDTSLLFPHRMGLPKKRALKNIVCEYLTRIIQEGEFGHDSAEDAEVCIQLLKYFLRPKIK